MMFATRVVDPVLAPSRAARGAAWLDRHHENWWSVINLENFRVANSTSCSLAWVYGDYGKGLDRVMEDEGEPRRGYTLLVDLGFDAELGPHQDRERYHAALQVAWVKEISRRQGVGDDGRGRY